ncbi:unnamed protein product [Durusdinium trenchii]|uniref:Solute carrier family 40 protein n=1 Tax=Durusdinium trenchii TaxID=1381693 RepID=A0ABP0RFS1_9DINO
MLWSDGCHTVLPTHSRFLGLSYSLLYLTVLSPHGAFLTAHLAQRHVPSYQLSLLRGAGALLGVTGVLMHPPAQELLGARVADAVFVLWLAGWTVMALDAFHRAPDAGMTPTLLLFMSAVCLARPGLYGFELGVLNTEQDFSDARHRSAIGAVDSALTSFATLAMYGSGLVLTRPDQFVVLVDGSTLFVSLGAGVAAFVPFAQAQAVVDARGLVVDLLKQGSVVPPRCMEEMFDLTEVLRRKASLAFKPLSGGRAAIQSAWTSQRWRRSESSTDGLMALLRPGWEDEQCKKSPKVTRISTDPEEAAFSAIGVRYTTAEGYRVAETFGVPLAVLLGAGHRLAAPAADFAAGGAGGALGFAVQLGFQAPVQLLVEATVGPRTLKCTHTWGAGGHMKQCSLSRIQLPGALTLTFRAAGSPDTAGGSAGHCVALRLDLEISSQQASDAARRCFAAPLPAAAPPLLTVSGSGVDRSIPLTRFSSPAPNGIIWKAALPAAAPHTFNRLYARLSFPSMVHPMRILIEELQPWVAIGEEPQCLRRCFTGTASAYGQVVQRLLPPAMPFAIWILADDHDGSGISGGHCANYDFELNLRPLASQRIAQEFLGPPAWLCEGGAWPRRLEQRNQGSQVVDPGELQVLRQRRFALRDLFDLTRPPERGEGESAAAAGSLGGLHALEIQVTEPSIFRLTTHAPTVPARPMLVPGHREEAWLALAKPQEFPTRRIPAAGREFRHSISVELAPGDYTLLFVLEMPTGGLRPCASLLVNLLLEPLGAGGSCGSDAGNGILDLQAMAEPVPLSAWRPQPMSFMITLPRPPGTFEEGAGDAQGLQIIARSSMNLGVAAEGNAPPVVLHAKVTSPFSAADLQVTFYENGQPLGEPQPLPDGNGYTAMAGPAKKESFYEVVLFHVPRHHSSRTTCVEFNVELAALSLTPPTVQGQFIAPLPGAETCWQQEQLPNILRVRAFGRGGRWAS